MGSIGSAATWFAIGGATVGAIAYKKSHGHGGEHGSGGHEGGHDVFAFSNGEGSGHGEH